MYYKLYCGFQREEDGGMVFTDLPSDCIRAILLRFTDGSDLINAGLAHQRTYSLAEEKTIWKDLCLFHFDNHQIQAVLRNQDINLEQLDAADWKLLYDRLTK